MKTRLLSALAALAAVLTVIGSLDLSGILPILPDKVALFLATALPGLAAVVHTIKTIGDALDDGAINGSWKPKLYPACLWLTCGSLSFPLVSCAGLGAALTGQPLHTTTVQRVEGPGVPFEVATTDVVRAETQQGRQWGIYDAGAVAARAREVVASGK